VETTRRLAEFIVSARYDEVDAEAIRLSKRHLLDWLGAALVGYAEPGGRIITRFVQEMGGVPEARLLVSGVRAPASNAALANGTLGHLADFDDSGFSHPTACIAPVLLALGEKLRVPGTDILLAQNLGYECFGRFYLCAKAYELVLRCRGVHPTSLWGTLAAAVTAGKLLKLDEDQTAMALGLAASQAAGLMENFGTMTKGFHCGDAARAGIVSAQLVQMGYDASATVLEGGHGFYHALVGEGHYDLSQIAEDLGKTWLIVTQGLDIKRHPSCAATLRAIEATIGLAKEHRIRHEQVDSIEVRLSSTRRDFLRFDNPLRGDEAKFSMQYAVAAALVDGDVNLESYRNDKVRSEVMSRTMAKVRLVVWDESADEALKQTTPIKITLSTGVEYTRDIPHFTGSSKNPMSDEEVHAKFRHLGGKVGVPTHKLQKSVGCVLDLEHRVDLSELIDSLVLG
jgi:2-methylcitrate dehydratase PrpD